MHVEFIRSQDRVMPMVAEPLAVRSLTIWHCKFKTLAPLESFRNLVRLTVASYPDESFDHIALLSALQDLRILHFPHVRDLSPLGTLGSLVSLSLESLPSWDASRRRLVVESLAPLAKLPSLLSLQLFGVVPPESSLAALEASASLKTARFRGYPQAEVARFFLAKGIENAACPPSAG